MRIVIKPLGLVVLITVAICIAALPRLFPLISAEAKAKGKASKSIASNKYPDLLKDASWETYADPGAGLEKHSIAVTSPAISNAYRFDVGRVGEHSWSMGYHGRLEHIFTAQSKVVVKFWARSLEKRDLTVAIQGTIAPYTVVWDKTVKLSTEWKEYRFEVKPGKRHAGELYLSFFLGASQSSVELGDIRMIPR